MKLIIAEKPSMAQSIARALNITERKNGYEQIKRFSKHFQQPEVFVKINDKIAAIPTKPSIKAKLNRLQKEKDGRDKTQPQKPPPKQEL